MEIKKIYLSKILSKYLLDNESNYKIKWLNFEFNSSCNLRCKWCSLDHEKKREIMDENVLAKTLDELVNDDKFNIERIDLHNAGETLLHPRLRKLLDIIAQKNKK